MLDITGLGGLILLALDLWAIILVIGLRQAPDTVGVAHEP